MSPCYQICLRYDSVEGNTVATASEDSTVKLWNTGNGRLLKTFRGGSGNVLTGLAVCGSLIAACGTDRMCRIWNMRTDRLVRAIDFGICPLYFDHDNSFSKKSSFHPFE